MMKSVAVILGSAFQDSIPQALNLERIEIGSAVTTKPLIPAYFLFTGIK